MALGLGVTLASGLYSATPVEAADSWVYSIRDGIVNFYVDDATISSSSGKMSAVIKTVDKGYNRVYEVRYYFWCEYSGSRGTLYASSRGMRASDGTPVDDTEWLAACLKFMLNHDPGTGK